MRIIAHMNIIVKKTKAGLLLQATEKQNGKTVTRPLKTLPKFVTDAVSSTVKFNKEWDAHQKWLANTAARIRRHYNKQEEGYSYNKDGWDNAGAVEFFIRDLFYGDPQAMRGVVVQCVDWLKGIHGIKLTKEEAAGGRWRSTIS